jgi:hypothetical protein
VLIQAYRRGRIALHGRSVGVSAYGNFLDAFVAVMHGEINDSHTFFSTKYSLKRKKIIIRNIL